MLRFLFRITTLFLAWVALSSLASAAGVTYVKVGHLFESRTGRYRSNVVLVLDGDRIRSVEDAAFAIPAGAAVVDLANDFVLPGLIDCHTHLTGRADRYDPIHDFDDSYGDHAIFGVRNARVTLEAGFIPGPRIVASGPPFSITGGHGDLNNYAPETSVTLFPGKRDFAIADGEQQVQQTVREQVKYGVDVIKILASGGVLSKGDQPGAPQYTLAELKMAADTAHQAGRKIAAHAHGAQSIKWSIEAGIDSIEHASLVDDEGIRLAKQHGTYFVMDIYDDTYILGEAKKFGIPEELTTKEKALGQTQRDNFRKAFQAGVKMAFGTDAGVYPHGDNAKQFHYMVEYGMSPAQAIQAATISAADLIGRSQDVGELSANHFADLVALHDDPLQHVEALEHIPFVMKGGAVIKNDLTAPPQAPR